MPYRNVEGFEKVAKRRNLKLVAPAAVGVLLLIILVAGFALTNSTSRARSQISSTVVVHIPGLHGQQVVAVGSILNNSLIFYSGDKIAVKIALSYEPFPGDPNSVKIIAVNDSDGIVVSSISPSLPTNLTGSPGGIAITAILASPSSSYVGDLHMNVVFYVPPPPP